jgi:HPt (histidine-containing phosphotransfer) domain-containing protein
MTDNPIDPPAFAALLDSIGGDREFLTELIETFFSDAPAQFAILKSSLAEGHAETFRRAAHSFKSNAASFGATNLTALCKRLEDLGKSGDLSSAADLLAEAEAEYEQVRAVLEMEIASPRLRRGSQ